MKALTVRQPWCSAITYGDKRVENRSKPIAHRGPLMLHAGLSVDWDADKEAWVAAGLTPYAPGAQRGAWRASLPLGAVVAVAELTDCHHADDCNHICPEPEDWDWRTDLPCTEHEGPCRNHCSPWAFPDAWHWKLANVHPLPEPVPCKGALGLWRLPEDVKRAVTGQLTPIPVPVRDDGARAH
jgi:hypothetical protein